MASKSMLAKDLAAGAQPKNQKHINDYISEYNPSVEQRLKIS